MNIENAKLELPTRDTYVSRLSVATYDFREWSDPMYKCHKCDGGMCKNLKTECASLPPMYIYKCNKCGYTDYLPQ